MASGDIAGQLQQRDRVSSVGRAEGPDRARGVRAWSPGYSAGNTEVRIGWMNTEEIKASFRVRD